MSKHEREQEKLFTRRAVIMAGGQMALLGALAMRMFQLQVLDRDKYLQMANQNRINISLIAPERGIIYDRFDVPLAINIQDFRLLLTAEQSPDINDTISKINRLISLPPERIEKILRDLKRQHKFLPVLIEDNLTWDQMTSVEVSLPNLPGVSIQEGKIRSYPLNDATAHVIGYVGIANEKDLQADSNPMLDLPGFQIGKSGLEKFYDTTLRGSAGRAEEEVNSVGRQVRLLHQENGITGNDLHLTLDAELQLFVQGRLANERSASAVILDAYTGAVYALASHPAFDPNVFSGGIPYALWNELLTDKAAPLTNKIIAGQYPPGSTFKMMTALAALEAGTTSEARKVFCAGHIDLNGNIFNCWQKNGHGSLNIVEALQQSCDCYFYQMALDTGIEHISAMAKRFGFGALTGIDMPGERAGIAPNQEWKLKRYKQKWQVGDSLNSAIGQGYTLTTPLQLALMTARLVNGGIAVTPYLVEKAGQTALHKVPTDRMGINPLHFSLVKQGMDAVVNTPRGTAHSMASKDPAFAYGGKSGTAQVRRITMEERKRGFKIEMAPWEQQHHALFVGYAPVGDPRYVAAVVIEHGGGGSAVAAPIVRDILTEAQKRTPEKQMQR